MRRRTARIAVSALAAGGLLLVASTLLADARTEARRHFRSGMEQIANGQYSEGIDSLLKANEILPHPNVLFNIARAYVEAGDLEKALEYYRRYVETEPPDKEESLAIMGQLQARLDRQRQALAASQRATTTPEGPATPTTPDQPTAAGEGTGIPVQGEQAADVSAGSVPLPAGQVRTQDVYEETIVTASRGEQSPVDAPNSTTIITQQDIELSGITRVEELLRRVAGIDFAVMTGGITDLSMRGFNGRQSNKLLVLVEGRNTTLDVTGGTLYQTLAIDVSQIQRIEVVRGPASALYGADAFGGVVNIIMKAPGTGGSGVKVGGGDDQALYASAWSSGRDGPFAYRMAGGYSQYPRWSRQLAENRVDVVVPSANQNTGIETKRFELRTTRRLGKEAVLGVGGSHASSDVNLMGVGPFYEMTLDQFEVSEATLFLNTKHLNARTYVTRFYGSDFGIGSAYRGQNTFLGAVSNTVADGELEFVAAFDTGPLNHDIHVGTGYRLKHVDWHFIGEENKVEHHFAMYLQDTIAIGEQWRVTASGRADYVPYLERIVLSPRASVIFKPTDRQAIRASYATSFRTPTFLEAYVDVPLPTPVAGVHIDSLGNRFSLDPERVQTTELGYINQTSDFFDYELSAYYNRVDNLIEVRPIVRGSLSGLESGELNMEQAVGTYPVGFSGFENHCAVYHVFGGELGVRTYPIEGLDVFGNYALNYTDTDRPAGCTINDEKRTSRHKFNLGVQVRSKIGFNGEVILHHVTEQQWALKVADAATGQLVIRLYDIPAYTLLNAKIGYRFLNEKAEISGTVFNLLRDVHQEFPAGQYVDRRFMAFGSYLF